MLQNVSRLQASLWVHANPFQVRGSPEGTLMGRPFKQYLNAPRIYSCGSCRSHVSDHEEIISKVRLRPCSPDPESMHKCAASSAGLEAGSPGIPLT